MKPLLVGAAALAVAGTAIGIYAAQFSDSAEVVDQVDVDQREGRAALVSGLRRQCDPAPFDAFLAEQRQLVASEQGDARAQSLMVLATACVERIALANSNRGLRVGEPMYDAVPDDIAGWVEEGTAALAQARELGLDTSESYRLESALLSSQIVGIGSAFNLSGKVAAALDRAEELDSRNPHIQVARGLRALLAPRILGHDPERALRHFEKAIEGLPLDERPRVFAAMAAWLLEDEARAMSLVEEAVSMTPANLYARAVRQRMADGDAQPFAADVSEEELQAFGR